LLTQELEKMDQAIDLATKAIEAQNRLQMAQGMLTPPPPGPSVNAQAVPGTGSSSSQWLELLLSAAIGAGIAVGAAQYLGRRRRYPGDDEAPLAFSGYRAEVTPSIPPRPSTIPPVTIAPASAPTAAPTATRTARSVAMKGRIFRSPPCPRKSIFCCSLNRRSSKRNTKTNTPYSPWPKSCCPLAACGRCRHAG